MDSVNVPWFFTMGVSTFGNPRIEAYLQLPAAYRSLSRPSSAPDAKAFTLCSCSLELLANQSFDQFILVLTFLELLEFLKTGFSQQKGIYPFCLIHLSVKLFLPLIGKAYFSSRQFLSTRSKSLSSLSVFSTLLRFIRFSMTSKPLGFCLMHMHLVGTSGLEPPTSRLSGARSNLLSYAPIVF